MKKKKPNLILMLGDDYGWNNVGFHNPDIITPNLNNLVKQGVKLDRHYTYKFCSPTRSAAMTGRYSLHVNQENSATSQAFAGVPEDMTMLPKKLKKANYATHHVGKWHLGQSTPTRIPFGRGFDTSIGFFNWGEDHYTQIRGSQAISASIPAVQCSGVDLWRSNKTYSGPAYGQNGTYNGVRFVTEAVRIIQQHDPTVPLFMFIAWQNCHGPLEVPEEYINKYPVGPLRTKYNGMTTFMDEGIGKVVAALQSANLWSNTLLVFSSDNGGPIGSANNDPLLGYKFDDLEGGVRTVALAAGGLLKNRNGTTVTGYIHISDWYVTFCGLAGVDPTDDIPGLPGIDGLDVWDLVSGKNNTSPRVEIPLSAFPDWANESIRLNSHYPSGGPKDLRYWASGEGLIVGDYKLVTGIQHTSFTNGSKVVLDCGSGCLFNIINDPTESTNLNLTKPNLLTKLQTRLSQIRKTVYAPDRGREDPMACEIIENNGGFWAPWINLSNTS